MTFPWFFHFFSKFLCILSLSLKWSPSCFEICKVTKFHLNKKIDHFNYTPNNFFLKKNHKIYTWASKSGIEGQFLLPAQFFQFSYHFSMFLLIFSKFHDISRFSRYSLIFKVFHVERGPWQNPCNNRVLFHCATHFTLVFLWYKGLALWFGLRGYITFLSVYFTCDSMDYRQEIVSFQNKIDWSLPWIMVDFRAGVQFYFPY